MNANGKEVNGIELNLTVAAIYVCEFSRHYRSKRKIGKEKKKINDTECSMSQI